MSQEVANAKAIGRAVDKATSGASLSDITGSLAKSVKRGYAQGKLNAKKRAKQTKQPAGGGLPYSSEDSVKVSSTRLDTQHYPYVQKSLTSPKKAIGDSSTPVKKQGPAAITAPGPTAKESASKKAAKAKKGTKNTSSIKVAEPAVDLESPTGKLVYNITDLPRQWNKNGKK